MPCDFSLKAWNAIVDLFVRISHVLVGLHKLNTSNQVLLFCAVVVGFDAVGGLFVWDLTMQCCMHPVFETL